MSQVDDIIKTHLQAASAAQRHVYVAGSNYDDNLPHLQYLAAQTDLDQATAKMMFWCLAGAIWHSLHPSMPNTKAKMRSCAVN